MTHEMPGNCENMNCINATLEKSIATSYSVLCILDIHFVKISTYSLRMHTYIATNKDILMYATKNYTHMNICSMAAIYNSKSNVAR